MFEIVLFLVGSACGHYNQLVNQFPDAYVYCTGDQSWNLARMNLYGFEDLYHVVYIDDSSHTWGQTYDNKYSVSRSWNIEIRHELEHQYCKCFYTADGFHGSPQTGAKN